MGIIEDIFGKKAEINDAETIPQEENKVGPEEIKKDVQEQPTVDPGTGLTFPAALKHVIDGSKITRTSWNSDEEYGYMAEGFLKIHTKGKDNIWMVNDGDLLAFDWIVIPEAN